MARRSIVTRSLAASVSIPVTVALVLFAVSNRGVVALEFWPIPGTLGAPLYLVGLAAVGAGFLIGGGAVYLATGGTRRRLRALRRETATLETRLRNASRNEEAGKGTETTAKLPAPATQGTAL